MKTHSMEYWVKESWWLWNSLSAVEYFNVQKLKGIRLLKAITIAELAQWAQITPNELEAFESEGKWPDSFDTTKVKKTTDLLIIGVTGKIYVRPSIEAKVDAQVVMDPVSLFYLNLGQAIGGIYRKDVEKSLKDKGFDDQKIFNLKEVLNEVVLTAYIKPPQGTSKGNGP